MEPVSSSLRNIRPGFRLELPFEKSSTELTYSAQIRDYSAKELQHAGDVTHSLELDAHVQITPIFRLSARDHLVRGVTEVSEFDPGRELRFGTNPFLAQNAQVTLAYGAGGVQSVEVGAELQTTRFDKRADDDVSFNFSSRGLFARYFLETAPANQAYAVLDMREVDQNRSSLEITPTSYRRRSTGLGLRRRITPELGSDIEIAYSTTRFDDPRGVPFRGLVIDGNLQSQLTAAARVSLKLRRGPQQSFFNVNAYYVNEMAQIAWVHSLGQRFVLKFDALAQRNAYPMGVRVKVSGPEEEQFDGNNDGIIDVYALYVPSEGMRRRDRWLSETLTIGYNAMRGVRLSVGYHRERARSNIHAEGAGKIFQPFDFDGEGLAADITFGWQ